MNPFLFLEQTIKKGSQIGQKYWNKHIIMGNIKILHNFCFNTFVIINSNNYQKIDKDYFNYNCVQTLDNGWMYFNKKKIWI